MISPTVKFVPIFVFAPTFKKLPTLADVPILTFEPKVPELPTFNLPTITVLLATKRPVFEPFADIWPLKIAWPELVSPSVVLLKYT